VLRTLGATSVQVFAIYLMLAVAMGLLGSLLGALAGVGLQQAMPLVLHAFIPANVRIVPSLRAIASGAALGVWTAAVFALLPLAGIRAVSPLATLRRNTDPPRMRWDALRIAAVAALIVSVVALAAVAAGSLERGAWFAGAIGGTIAVLWLASLALMAAARRWIPVTLPYLFRQGLANLHRPANQTLTVVLALGFGTFLLGTVFSVQRNLLEVVQVDRPGRSRANLVLFDVQTGQRALVDSVLRAESVAADSFTPMVPMRIRELKGQAVSTLESSSDTLTADAETDRNSGASGAGPSLWALRREYRSTWRATLNPADHLVAGRWFVPSTAASGRTAADPAPISMESGLAAELGVTVGDAITWDVQGVPVYSRVMSLRDVDWARFELNFFVVFAPGALESAPQTWATMAHAPNDTVRGRVQREVAERAANVTAIDLAEVQAALETVISHIATAIRFMALFSLFTGAVVLVGAIATSRWQRVREGTLLRTLGATRAQVLIILIVEYIALGFAAAFVASLLAVAAGWSLAHWEFKTPFVAPWLQLGLLALVLVALTVTAGLWGSVEVLKRPPLEVLRND
jgi:putative ABC transport system permease protein